MANATITDLKLEQWLRNRQKKQITWNGVPIQELSDNHITNIINKKENAVKNETNIKPESFNFY